MKVTKVFDHRNLELYDIKMNGDMHSHIFKRRLCNDSLFPWLPHDVIAYIYNNNNVCRFTIKVNVVYVVPGFTW